MYNISLKNNKTFQCSEDDTLIEGARKSNIILEHSCLIGRCSSCKVKVDSGISEPIAPELSLTEKEKNEGFILSCIRTPKSNIVLEAEDLSKYNLSIPKTFPAKINSLQKLTDDILRVELRLPPNQLLNFVAGQYINIIRGNIKRSYSIGNYLNKNSSIELYIKNYTEGKLSKYWFSEAKVNDLLRIEGPKGTFFLRKGIKHKNVIFLATGTGIAPVKSILEAMSGLSEEFKDKRIYVFWGVRSYKDLFWTPDGFQLDINYFPVLSREKIKKVETGYVQNVLLRKKVNLTESIVYACGSNNMILDAKNILIENGLPALNFYSDAFVISN
jgi:CDP-4-dehydro-6-deoxyglucose reductase